MKVIKEAIEALKTKEPYELEDMKQVEWDKVMKELHKSTGKCVKLLVDRTDKGLEGLEKGIYPYGMQPVTRWAHGKETANGKLLAEFVEVKREKTSNH